MTELEKRRFEKIIVIHILLALIPVCKITPAPNWGPFKIFYYKTLLCLIGRVPCMRFLIRP